MEGTCQRRVIHMWGCASGIDFCVSRRQCLGQTMESAAVVYAEVLRVVLEPSLSSGEVQGHLCQSRRVMYHRWACKHSAQPVCHIMGHALEVSDTGSLHISSAYILIGITIHRVFGHLYLCTASKGCLWDLFLCSVRTIYIQVCYQCIGLCYMYLIATPEILLA